MESKRQDRRKPNMRKGDGTARRNDEPLHHRRSCGVVCAVSKYSRSQQNEERRNEGGAAAAAEDQRLPRRPPNGMALEERSARGAVHYTEIHFLQQVGKLCAHAAAGLPCASAAHHVQQRVHSASERQTRH